MRLHTPNPIERDRELRRSREPISVGDDVVIGHQSDPKDDLLYFNYFGRVTKVEKEYAFVDSDAVGLPQSVSFKAWLPIRTLTRTA